MGFIAWWINQLGRDMELAMPNEYRLGHLKGNPLQKGTSGPAEFRSAIPMTKWHWGTPSLLITFFELVSTDARPF